MLSSCEITKQVAHDVGGGCVLLIEDLHVSGGGGQVAVAESVPYLLDVYALIDEPGSLRYLYLILRIAWSEAVSVSESRERRERRAVVVSCMRTGAGFVTWCFNAGLPRLRGQPVRW